MFDYSDISEAKAKEIHDGIATKDPRKIKLPKTLAVIDQSGCTGCEACIQFCPVDCIEIVPGAQYVDMGKLVEVDLNRCIGCKLCAKYCPWDTIFMIPSAESYDKANDWTLRSVIKLEDTAEKRPHLENLRPNSLYKYLSGTVPLLVGDRSLSTYGRKILKGLRSKESGWPLPGVYSLVDLAAKFLQKNSQLKIQLSDLEIFARLVKERSELALEEIYEDFQNAKTLRKVMGYTEAAKFIAEEELSEKSRGILYTLLIMNKIGEEFAGQVALHPFDYLEEACELASKNDVVIDFHVAAPIQELFLIGFRDLYPLEIKFLEVLAKNYTIIKQEETLLPSEIKEVPQESEMIAQRKQILWASELRMAGPLESQLLSGSPLALRQGVSPSLRFYSPAIETLKKSWPKKTSGLEKYLAKEEVSEIKDLVQKMIDTQSPAAISMLESLKFFERNEFPTEKIERPLPLSQHPGHPVLLSMEDIPLIDPAQCLLWSTDKLKEFLADFCSSLNPLKNFRDLEKILLANGVVLPRIEEEQKGFESFFYAFSSSLKLLKESPAKTWELTETYSVKIDKNSATLFLKKALSPSALESLYKCPLHFHFHREQRLSTFELEDDLNVSPLRRGNWIHSTLEALSATHPKKITAAKIKETLLRHLQKAFDEKASASYLKLIEAQTGPMSEALYHYVQYVDLPLAEIFPNRQIKAELEISIQWNKEVLLRGRVDRLDFVGDGAFLWDYKSGNYSNSSLARHMENGKFQWMLYKNIFHRDGTPIHGGGYINPLDLRKSRLFFFESAPLKDSFYERLDQNNVKYERVSLQDENMLRENLIAKIDTLIKIWKSGERKAAPREISECDRCDFVGLCGYPYGVTP